RILALRPAGRRPAPIHRHHDIAERSRPGGAARQRRCGCLIAVGAQHRQNVPGLAVLRANGYQTPASPLITWTGFTGVLLAPFGGYSYNLAAITAAICMSRDADPDPSRRYLAAVWAGIFYLVIGIFGATVAGLFEAFPPALVAAIAGLALLGTIGNSLATALSDEKGRDAALITFLATASGISFAGISSAFWGMLLGFALHLLARRP